MATEHAVLPPVTVIAGARLESGADLYEQRIEMRRHVVLTDEPASRGGKDAGPTPVELLLGALAGCTAITLQMYAGRKGWNLGKLHIDLAMQRGPEGDRIQRTIRIAESLSSEQRARLLEIADKSPVTKMIKAGLGIDSKLQ